VTRPAFIDGLLAHQLDGEKGTAFTPIALPFTNLSSDTCELQQLILCWHDPLGLCRAATQDGCQLVLELNRHRDDDHTKLTQLVHFQHDISFPFFCNSDGEINMERFVICGVVYHLGENTSTGHWRAALKYQGHWMLYDDAKVPDRVEQLPEFVHRNCMLLWLVRETVHNARTMSAGDMRFPDLGTTSGAP
jgi:hypothetical protein